MHYSDLESAQHDEVIELYRDVFSAAANEDEGNQIAQLVTELLKNTAESDHRGFIATNEGALCACIMFSRVNLDTGIEAFLLSPVAVVTPLQRQGIGHKLINYGLETLRERGAEIVLTYGDPQYYSRAGFEPLSEALVKAPFPLSQPVGWQGQLLNGDSITSVHGTARCVAAFNNPAIW